MNLLKLVSKRKLFVWGLGIIVVLSLAVTAYFVIPKFSADTLTRTITVSGTFTDFVTGKRVAGAQIGIYDDVPMAMGGSTVIFTTTDKNGFYSSKINVNLIGIDNNYIKVHATASGYVDDDSRGYIGPTDTLTINMTTSKIPVDIVSNKVLDPISVRCRTSQDPQGFPVWIHTGDYQGKIVNGVLFCARASEAAALDKYNNDITNAASQVRKLLFSTGLGYTPTVYLTGDITWNPDAAAYVSSGGQEIVIDVRYLGDLSVVTHEFGHLVDWVKGWESSFWDLSLWTCSFNNAKTKRHCYSSDDNTFLHAASIAGQGMISDYATTDYQEMFAEMFASLETPDSPGSSSYLLRQNTQVKIANALLEKSQTPFGGHGGSTINLPANPAQQNAAMYLYKFVAQKSHLDEYFPGRVGGWSMNQIRLGQYMPTAFLSVKVSENNQPVNNLNVTIGNVSGTPTALQGLYLGTLTMKNVIVDKNVPITLSTPGLNYSPAKVNLVQGSNPVIDISTIPKATVSPPTNITTSSVTLSGSVTGVIHSDSVTARGFKYWKNPDPKNDPNCGQPPPVQIETVYMGSGTGNFSFTFGQQASPPSPSAQPLYSDTFYCYGAYAFSGKDSIAPASSNLISFKTLPITVTNSVADPVAQTTATLRGHVDKPVYNQFFSYGINPDPVGDPSCSKYVESYNGVNATNSNGDLAAPLTGLTPNTNYCYSAQIITFKDLIYAKSPDGKKVWQVFKTTP